MDKKTRSSNGTTPLTSGDAAHLSVGTKLQSDTSVGLPAVRILALHGALTIALWAVLASSRLSHGSSLLSESGIIENAQLLLLAGSVTIFFRGSPRFEANSLGRVVGWLLTAAFVRELDGHLDVIYHGSWKVFAAPLVFMALRTVLAERAQLACELDWALRQRSAGLAGSALLVVVIYSRLLGRQDVWHSILGDLYMHEVPRLVEEAVEFVGYGMLLVSAFDWRGDA